MALLALSLPLSTSAFAEESQLRPNSIDAGRIAFTRKFNNQKDIYVVDFVTGKFTPLVATPAIDEYPSWSPDGSKIVFYSDMCGDREIFSIKDDGTELKRLTNSQGIDEDPDWSPDGKQIVFRSERKGRGSSTILTMNADGSGIPKELSKSEGENSVPRWSPRGNEIVYATNAFWPGWDMLLVNANSLDCLLYTSPSPRDATLSRMPSSA